ncbi:hypothetical protein M9458_029674, partial [Cirrhinus mrigala]
LEGADCPRLRSPRLSSRFCRGRAAAVIVGIAHRSMDGLGMDLPRSSALSLGRKPARSLSESLRRSGLRQLSKELTARTLAAHASLPEGSFRGGSPHELPRGSGPTFAEAELLLRPWGSEHGSGEWVRDKSALSLPFSLDLALSLGAFC